MALLEASLEEDFGASGGGEKKSMKMDRKAMRIYWIESSTPLYSNMGSLPQILHEPASPEHLRIWIHFWQNPPIDISEASIVCALQKFLACIAQGFNTMFYSVQLIDSLRVPLLVSPMLHDFPGPHNG